MTALLLDEMLAPKLAALLVREGHDVEAISAHASWRGLPDPEVLALATANERILVTENVRDFAGLSSAWEAQGRVHGGLLFISTKAYPPNRHRLSRLTAAITRRFDTGDWPASGQYDFL